jgi:phospholipase D1/2
LKTETRSVDFPVQHSGPAWGKIAAIAIVVAALAVAWRYTPLSELVTAERVVRWAEEVGQVPWTALVVMAAYTPACFIMFPRPLITLFLVLAFGPWSGLAYSLLGITAAALATYLVGHALPRDTVRKLAGSKINEMTAVLRRRGLLAVFAVRIVPVAPFAIEGMVAGAIGIKLWHFALGTVLGMLPGTLTTTVFGDQIKTALVDPSRINYWLVAAVAVFFVVLIAFVRRWFMKQQRAADAAGPS